MKVLKKLTLTLKLHKWYERPVKNEIGRTLINANTNSTAAIGSSNTRKGFNFGIGNIQRNLCGKFSLLGVFAGPGIECSSSHGVQQNLSFHITNIWQVLLNLDKRVLDHHVAHNFVGR